MDWWCSSPTNNLVIPSGKAMKSPYTYLGLPQGKLPLQIKNIRLWVCHRIFGKHRKISCLFWFFLICPHISQHLKCMQWLLHVGNHRNSCKLQTPIIYTSPTPGPKPTNTRFSHLAMPLSQRPGWEHFSTLTWAHLTWFFGSTQDSYKDGSIHKDYLVGGFNSSEKYWSIGMIIPNIWKNKSHVRNHTPDKYVIWV